MKNIVIISIGLFSIIGSLISCQKNANSVPYNQSVTLHPDFGKYWYSGVAEINAYNLEQARYGEIHNGKAVLIFVTEAFSKSKQVKLDYPQQNIADEQTVLKLNFTKKFNTGIYPYSMMLSAFTPVELAEYPNTPKVTMSSQEWCGQVFSQVNLSQDNYQLRSYSYFEKEGDVDLTIDKKLLEDEIWNKIRLSPETLPKGTIEIIPGLFHTRLLHKELKPQQAIASISEDGDKKIYTLEYPEEKRILEITFESAFPYKILAWSEIITGLKGKKIATKATLDKTLRTDYWTNNNVADSYLRDSLNLN